MRDPFDLYSFEKLSLFKDNKMLCRLKRVWQAVKADSKNVLRPLKEAFRIK